MFIILQDDALIILSSSITSSGCTRFILALLFQNRAGLLTLTSTSSCEFGAWIPIARSPAAPLDGNRSFWAVPRDWETAKTSSWPTPKKFANFSTRRLASAATGRRGSIPDLDAMREARRENGKASLVAPTDRREECERRLSECVSIDTPSCRALPLGIFTGQFECQVSEVVFGGSAWLGIATTFV